MNKFWTFESRGAWLVEWEGGEYPSTDYSPTGHVIALTKWQFVKVKFLMWLLNSDIDAVRDWASRRWSKITVQHILLKMSPDTVKRNCLLM